MGKSGMNEIEEDTAKETGMQEQGRKNKHKRNKEDRGKGYGKFLLDYVKEKSKEKDCKALILDSGLPRVEAHGFYEHYGFAKNCYGFQLVL